MSEVETPTPAPAEQEQTPEPRVLPPGRVRRAEQAAARAAAGIYARSKRNPLRLPQADALQE